MAAAKPPPSPADPGITRSTNVDCIGRTTVTRTSRRAGRLAALAAAGLLALTACGEGDAARPGAAATVGDQRVATSELQELVQRGSKNEGAKRQIEADRAGFERQQLSTLVRRELLAQAAERKDVKVTGGEVDARIDELAQQSGGREALESRAAESGVAAADIPDVVEDIVLADKLGDKLVEDVEVPAPQLQQLYQQNAEQFNQVHSAHILVKDKAASDQILRQVKGDPSKFAEIAEAQSIDTSNKDKGGDLGFAGRGAFVKPFADAIFNGKPGDIVQVQTEFGWHVVRIIEKKTVSLQEATPQLRAQALGEQRNEKLRAYLSEVAKDVGVKINPRFGSWNSKELEIAPPKDRLSTPGGPAGPGEGGPQEGQPPVEQGQPQQEQPQQEQPQGNTAPSPAG